MDEISLLTLGILFAASLIAGTIDAVAGGGGLITLPALLMAGVPPVASMATSKFQAMWGTLSATHHFWRKGHIKLSKETFPIVTSMLGAALGSLAVALINPEKLKIIIPAVLIGIAVWILFSPRLGEVKRSARISMLVYVVVVLPLITFYDGILGPGTGTFLALSGVALLGRTLDEATIHAKLFNAASNVGSILVFIFGGHIVWVIGGLMAVGNLLGGQLGARLVLKHGTKLIKPLLIITSVAMSLKLLSQQPFFQKILG